MSAGDMSEYFQVINDFISTIAGNVTIAEGQANALGQGLVLIFFFVLILVLLYLFIRVISGKGGKV